MSEPYDAIVVGGGLAGLTSAAYLCRYGYRTLLCEKAPHTGGLVKTFWHQGFAFDAGIRAFENSGILLPMLKSLGIDMEIIRNNVSIGIGDHWTKLDSRDSLQPYTTMLTSLFPEEAQAIARIAEEIRKVMGYMDVLYGIDNPLFLENFKDRDYLMKTLLPWLIRYQVNIRKANRLNEPVYAYLRRFTSNMALIDMIAQHFFKQTPSFFALSYFGLYLDYSYPKGGTGQLAHKVTDYIQTAGGEIRLNAAIDQVDTQTREIQLANGERIGYKKLVWAADQRTLYAATHGPDSPDIQKNRQLAEQSEGGDSVLSLFMGVDLDRGYFSDRCGAHAFYTPSTVGLSALPRWEDVVPQGDTVLTRWVGQYLENTTYEISCPALRDASLAPAGKTGIIVSTLMDYRLVRHFAETGGYEAFKAYCTDKIQAILGGSIFPGIQDKTLFALCATPMTIERETGNRHGAITGWAFTNAVMPSENRFQKIARSIQTPFEDIYQCGQWSFSPSGLPISILTGKLAADAVKKHWRP